MSNMHGGYNGSDTTHVSDQERFDLMDMVLCAMMKDLELFQLPAFPAPEHVPVHSHHVPNLIPIPFELHQ